MILSFFHQIYHFTFLQRLFALFCTNNREYNTPTQMLLAAYVLGVDFISSPNDVFSQGLNKHQRLRCEQWVRCAYFNYGLIRFFQAIKLSSDHSAQVVLETDVDFIPYFVPGSQLFLQFLKEPYNSTWAFESAYFHFSYFSLCFFFF